MKGNDKCDICWGTGFYKGYGAPCTEGKIHSGPECRYDPADAIKAGRSIPQWASPPVAVAPPNNVPNRGGAKTKFQTGDRVRYASRPQGSTYVIDYIHLTPAGVTYDVRSEQSNKPYLHIPESKLELVSPAQAPAPAPQINFKKGDRVRWSSPSAPPRDGTVIDRSIHGTIRVHLDGDIDFTWCSPHNLTHLSAAPF